MKIASEFVWVAAGHAGAVLAAVIGLGWLTRFLPPAAYGELALAISVSTFVGLVFLGPVAAAGARFLSVATERAEVPPFFQALRRIFVRRAFVILSTGALCSVIVMLVESRISGMLVVATTAFSVFAAGTVLGEGLLNAGRYRRAAALHKGMQQFLNYGFAVGLVYAWRPTADAAMLGFALGAMLTAVSELLALERRFHLRTGDVCCHLSSSWREAVHAYARPYERWGIFQWLQATSDRWFLAAFSSTREVGVYAVAYQLGYTPVGLLTVLITQTVEPVIFANAGGSDPAQIARAERLRLPAIGLFAGLSGVIVVALFFFHERIFGLLVDEAYWHTSHLLPWLALAASIFGVAQLESVKWLTRLRPERTLVSRVVGSIFGAVIVAIGAKVAGASGVTLGQIAFSVTFLIWMLRLR